MLNLAIVSKNKNQYSETFIHNHVQKLNATIFYLFDGYLPQKYSRDKGLTEHVFKSNNLINKLISGKYDDKIHIQSIRSYLKKNKIIAVLAEYGPSGVSMMDVCKSLNIPLIVHFHGYDAYRNDVLNSYGKQYPELFENAAAIICVSENMKQQLIAMRCPIEKLHLFHYGVDTDFFVPTYDSKKDVDFVFCGRFTAKKAPDKLIQSFSLVVNELPNANLYMIGKGELLNDCEGLAAQLGLKDNIVFCGSLKPAEVKPIFNRSKIYVQHSVKTSENDSEGLPLSILEAGACGLPVIATEHAGIPEVISNGFNGFLVEENNHFAFAEKMIQLVRNVDLIRLLGSNARARILKNHNLDNYLQKLINVIERSVLIFRKEKYNQQN